ncbi:MAG: penicillin-binding protein 1A, partial [Asticcacaulis sp.]|nr:penicillin-binding protein 1A [Asticcacaulis sp.]
DDNHSLGEHETGAVAALPIWMEFMKNATAGKPQRQFQKPHDAVFVSVRGIEEAFKPGTEPKYDATAVQDAGPRPYLDTWKDEDIDEAAPVTSPPEPQQPKKKTLDDATNLY